MEFREAVIVAATGRHRTLHFAECARIEDQSGPVFLTPEMLPLATIMINPLDGASSHPLGEVGSGIRFRE
jgi:hypothetical protein